jgi:Icc-related predicted phosphoesterase
MLVLGDAHAADPDRRRALLAAYDAAGADRALQVGDLEYYDPPVPTWFVAGNNEDFDVIEALRRRDRALGEPTLHLLAGTFATVEGLRVAGLSGNYAPTQYDRSRAALAGDRRRHFVREDVERALELTDVDVFLAHQAPHSLLRIRGRDPGCDPLDDVVAELSPALLLVGHYHRHAEATIDGTRVVSLAPAWRNYYSLDPETLVLERHPAPAGPER